VPKSDTEFLAVARKRRKQAIDALNDSRKVQLEDVRFLAGNSDNGWQWPEKVRQSRLNDPNGARPVLTINKLPQHIRLVTNEQRQNRPSVKVLPVDDSGDPEVAEIFNGMIRHIEVNSDADVAYSTAFDNQVAHGEGFVRLITDYVDEVSFEQDIFIRRVPNPFAVDMDPSIQDPSGADAEWVFISDMMMEEEFEAEYPDAEPVSWEEVGVGDQYEGWFDNENKRIRVAEYFYYESETRNILLWANGEVSVEGEALPESVVAGEKPLKKRPTKVRTVKWCKLTGCAVLDRRDWAGKYIPVVRFVGNEVEIDGKKQIWGLVRNAKDPQRMVNYWASQEAEILALAPKSPYVGASGQFEGHEDKWQRANTVNYAFLEYEPVVQDGVAVPPPQRSAPPIPPAGFIQAKLQASDDLQSTMGQYNPSLGAEADEKSGKAIIARQRQADVGTYHYLDNANIAIRHVGRILVDMIPKVYDTRRVARILGEDNEPDTIQIDPNQRQAVMEITDEQNEIRKIYNPNVGRYDVVSTVGPSFTTKRQEAAEAMNLVLQGNPGLWQVAGDLFVKNLDWPGAEELAKRLKKMVPPNLLEGDEPNKEDLEAKAAQLHAAGEMLSQKQQELQLAQQEIEKVSKTAMGEKAQADNAKAQAQKVVDQLNSQIEALGLQKQIMEKDIALQSAQLEADRAKIVAEMKILVSQFSAKIDHIMSEPDGDEDPAKAQEQEQQKAAAMEMHAQVMEALSNAIALISAPRRTTLQTDEMGNPVGAMSEVAIE